MRFQSITAKVSFGAFVLSLVIALAAALGTHAGLWTYKVGLPMILPAVAVGLIALIAGIVWAVTALIRNSSQGVRFGVIGLLGAVLVLAVPLNGLRLALTSPPIHDISTDIEFAPAFKAVLPLRQGAANGPEYDGPKPVKLPNGHTTTVAALQKKYYGDVVAWVGFTKPAKLFWRALNLANRMGWHVVAFDPKEGRIEATDTTFWFGFTDDIVIRVRPAGKLGARLDIRSKSRVGVSDLGSNAARLRTFLKTLKAMG
jgi:uncharacterized protein DUF1499